MKIGMILAVAALAVAGCGKKDEGTPAQPDAKPAPAPAPAAAAQKKSAPVDMKAVAVEVNGKKLTFGELDADATKTIELQQVPADQVEQARKYFYEQLAQQFVMKTILLDEAKKKGVKVTEEDRKKAESEMFKANTRRPGSPKSFAEVIEKHPFGKERGKQELEDFLVIRKLQDQEVVSKVTVDPKKVEDVLKRMTDQVNKAKNAEPKIKELKKSLDGLKGDALKTKFAELAKANSDCPSKDNGGDLGEFTRGKMVKEFEDVAFKIEPLVVSDPVKTRFGWHLIMVTKKVPAVEPKGATPASPEKVQASHILIKTMDVPAEVPSKEEIEHSLRLQNAQAPLRDYIMGLRAAAKIVAPTFPSLNPPPPKPAATAAAKPAAPAAKPAPAKIESKPVEVKPAAKPTAKIESKPVEVKPTAKPATPAPAPAAKPAPVAPAAPKKN